jgi:hypothetical protein
MCCTPDLRAALPEDSRNPACFPIEIPNHDPIYSKEGIQCMEFVRTTNDITQGCNSGNKPAEQVTDIMSAICGGRGRKTLVSKLEIYFPIGLHTKKG